MNSKENKYNVVEYENSLLGAILVEPEKFEKIKGLIVAKDFYDVRNQIVFQAIDDISEQGFALIEPTPIIKLLKNENNLEKIGGPHYLDHLISEAGLHQNIPNYIENIIEKARMRDVIAELDYIKKEIDGKHLSADDVLEHVESNIIANSRDSKVTDFKDAKSIIDDVLKEIELKLSGKITSGIPTEFTQLDKATGGLHKGDFIIIAARPSMGKTAFALNLAANISKTKHVGIFSIEMSSKQLMNRILGFTGFIPTSKIQKPEYLSDSENRKLSIATDKLEKYNLYIDDTPGIKLAEIVWKSKRLKKNKGLDLIIIDYLQLISTGSSNENRQAEVSVISRTLKKLARELEIPIIALSQLSRKVEQRESKIPIMSDLRESGAIEQDADIIAFLYREAYYASKDNEALNQAQETKLIIGKHRNGPTGTIKLSFNPDYGLFLDEIKGANND